MIDRIQMWSEALSDTIHFQVILPFRKKSRKIMLLLHGKMHPEMSREIFDLLPQELALEKLCEKYEMAVVIPLMKNRYYISGKDYDCNSFVGKELPQLIREKYGISDAAEMILAGISMGGFGAALIGARTGAFRKIISISGAFIVHDVAIGNPQVWGKLTPASKNLEATFLYHFLPLEDLETDAYRNALAALSLLPKGRTTFVVTCGTKDWLYPRNLAFLAALEQHNVKYKFYPIEDGEHEEECFRAGLRKALEYFSEMEQDGAM